MTASQRRVLRWVLGGLAVVVLLAVVLVANLAAQLSGGWDEVLDRSHPLPGDPDVVAARAAGAQTVDAEITRVVDLVVVPALTGGRVAQPAVTGPQALAESGVGLGSACEVGSHNWKRDDPFDLICTEVRESLVAGDAASLRPDVLAVHRALTSDGWQPEDGGLPGSLERADEFQASGEEDLPSREIPPAGYTSADGRFRLLVGFRSFDTDTGVPEPAIADDEFPMRVSVSHTSYRA
jgi:hypothetical protein